MQCLTDIKVDLGKKGVKIDLVFDKTFENNKPLVQRVRELEKQNPGFMTEEDKLNLDIKRQDKKIRDLIIKILAIVLGGLSVGGGIVFFSGVV